MVVLAFGDHSFAAHGFSFCIKEDVKIGTDLMKEWQEKKLSLFLYALH
ncbi:hypothetical protein A2U01_0079693, partial [Trifolium medium]|nr:hypothetical protein [Trifolium medium]